MDDLMNQYEKDLVVKVLNLFADKLNIISGSLQMLNYEITQEEFDKLARYLMLSTENDLTLESVTKEFINIKNYQIEPEEFEDTKDTVKKLLIGLKNEEMFEEIIETILKKSD